MKKNIWLTRLLMFLILLLSVYSFKQPVSNSADQLSGSWKIEDGNSEHILIFAGNYYAYTNFDKSGKQFLQSTGGVWQVQNNQLITKSEFDTQQKDNVGKSRNIPYSVSTNSLTLDLDGNQISFQRIDDGTGPLAGTWRITGRMQDGKLSASNTGPRKTLKFLSGTRFQWAAINPETKEFFGTGGGTYTFSNGKYTENIEFFPRDSSRVGMSLTFDGKVANGEWNHSGKSSKGDPIHEIWSMVK